MGTIECSQQASKSSWDSQDFGDISMLLKMAHLRKSTGPQWVNDRNQKDLFNFHRQRTCRLLLEYGYRDQLSSNIYIFINGVAEKVGVIYIYKIPG